MQRIMSPVWPRYFLFCLYFGSVVTTSDLFTSSQDLQEVLGSETLTLEDASFLLLLEKLRLQDAKERHRREMAAASHTDHSILGKFLSASRLSAFLVVVLAQRWKRENGSLQSAFTSPSSRNWWPTHRDLSGAAVGICRLQQVYDIPATRMAAMASPSMPAILPEEAVDVARGCFVKGESGNTSAWLQAAFLWAKSRGCPHRKLQLGASWLEENGLKSRYPYKPPNDVHRYKSVCVREGDLRPVVKDLFCRISTYSGHPIFVLSPLQFEVLSSKPRIVLFTGFLSRPEVNFIRHNSVSALARASIYGNDLQPNAVSWRRISKVAWLSDTQHDVLQRISRRIAAATNLSLESAEPYQVANYGLGGHYTPHLDPLTVDGVVDSTYKTHGNRLATMLFFLSDVPAGGATAFVELGLAVKPRAGDALFWFDVEPYDGSDFLRDLFFWHQKRAPDNKTMHLGCPVLRGSKWISTKWIHERGNVVVNYNFPG